MAQAREHSALSARLFCTFSVPGTMRFSSRIDFWLWAVLVFTLGAGAFALWSAGLRGSAAAVTTTLVACALAPALLLWLAWATHYELVEHDLLVRSGPFRWRVPLAQIRSVVPSRSVVSAPALSLDRLRIDYGRASSILISPRDKLRFLSELQRRCPGIDVASH